MSIIREHRPFAYVASATKVKGRAVIAVLANSPLVPVIDSRMVANINVPRPNLSQSAFFFFISITMKDSSSITEITKLCNTVRVTKNKELFEIFESKAGKDELFTVLALE